MMRAVPILVVLVAFLVGGCSSGDPRIPDPPEPVVEEGPAGQTVLLARRADLLADLALPERSRAVDATVPEALPLEGGRKGRTRRGATAWRFRVPIRTVHYGQEEGRCPFSMEVRDPEGRAVKYSRSRGGPDTWVYREGKVILRIAEDSPRPEGYTVRFPRGREEELALAPETAERKESAFALRSMPLYETVEHGVYLPAPAQATWNLSLPPRAWFDTSAVLLEPALGRSASDGAELVVEVQAGGQVHEVLRQALPVGRVAPLAADLSRWAGQEVAFRIRTEPGGSGIHDYVFLAQPAVYTPVAEPRRMVVLFVDTLRHDHLGLYGYERDTSPNLDALAEQSVVFEQARATAPWTLPSTRAFLTGRHAGEWDSAPAHVADLLGRAGWATVGMFTNSWLARTFDMDRGWGVYWTEASATVEDQVDRARRFLERYPHREAMVMVHIMEPHLPYEEPESQRHRWEGEEPAVLEGRKLDDNTVGRIWRSASPEDRQELLRYVIDRYDQNVRYVDTHVQELLDAVGPEATVVMFSDHGEEFFENGEIGHGFNLYEECIRVPLTVRAPGLEPARLSTPVSLLDLPATLVELGGGTVPAGAMQGRSLLPLARGDEALAQELADRPQAMGRNAFRQGAWAVYHHGRKWIASDGTERVYDLAADPGEEQDLVRGDASVLAPYHRALSRALGDRPVHRVWRLAGAGSGTSWGRRADRVEATHPQGFARAWYRPSPKKALVEPVLEQDRLRAVLTRSGDRELPREIYLQPQGDPLAVQGLSVTVARRDRQWTAQVQDEVPEPDGERHVLLTAGRGRRAMEVTWSVRPEPVEAEVTDLTGSTLFEELEALGYIDR